MQGLRGTKKMIDYKKKYVISDKRISEIENSLIETRVELVELNKKLITTNKDYVTLEKVSKLRYNDSLVVSLVLTIVALMHLLVLYIEIYGTRAPGNYVLFGLLGGVAIWLVLLSAYFTKAINELQKK